MQAYEEWAKRLFPASKSFTDFLNRFDKFATAHFKVSDATPHLP